MRTSGAERESMLREENRRLREQLETAQQEAERWAEIAGKRERDYRDMSGRLTDEMFYALVNGVTSRMRTIQDRCEFVDQEGLRQEYERILSPLFEQLETAQADRDQECVWRVNAEAKVRDLNEQLEAAEGLRRAALDVGMWGAPYHEALAEAVKRFEAASSPAKER